MDWIGGMWNFVILIHGTSDFMDLHDSALAWCSDPVASHR